MLIFNKNMFKLDYVLVFLTIILLPSAFFMPVEYSYENHLLENLEIIILLLGVFSVLYKMKFINIKKIKYFYVGCMIFYLIMIFRELSFGRVFYPIGVDEHGEQVFMSIHKVWYGEVVYPIVFVMIVIALFCMINCYLYVRRKQVICNIPVNHFVFFMVMMILSQVVFEKNLLNVSNNYAQLLEECTEIIAYCSLVCFTVDWRFEKNRLSRRVN